LSRARLTAPLLLGLMLAATACTGGVNAGEDGGVAFIIFAGMLLATIAILWLVLGRED
jgi:hypothetical protein